MLPGGESEGFCFFFFLQVLLTDPSQLSLALARLGAPMALPFLMLDLRKGGRGFEIEIGDGSSRNRTKLRRKN